MIKTAKTMKITIVIIIIIRRIYGGTVVNGDVFLRNRGNIIGLHQICLLIVIIIMIRLTLYANSFFVYYVKMDASPRGLLH